MIPSDVLPPFLYTVVVQGTPGVGRVKTSLSLGAASVHEQQSSTALITRPPRLRISSQSWRTHSRSCSPTLRTRVLLKQ